MINEIYFESFPHLESERLILRAFSLEDATDIHIIRTDDDVMNYMDSDKHQTMQDSEQFINTNLETYKQGKGIFWALTEKATNDFIGDFAFSRIIKEHHRAEIGYTLKSQYWGRGYMKEAMIEIIKFGFNRLNLHSLEANVNPENKNSSEILLRMGFKKEAHFRENHFFNGRYYDSEIYSLLERDFKYR